MPPWGWWPLAFISLFLLDQLLSGVVSKKRFDWFSSALMVVPKYLLMIALTIPGYIVQGLLFKALWASQHY